MEKRARIQQQQHDEREHQSQSQQQVLKQQALQQQALQQQSAQQQVIKRREELRLRYEPNVVILQKYIRGWRDRQEVVGLIVIKLRALRETLVFQQQEVEEWRRIIQMSQKAVRRSKAFDQHNPYDHNFRSPNNTTGNKNNSTHSPSKNIAASVTSPAILVLGPPPAGSTSTQGSGLPMARSRGTNQASRIPLVNSNNGASLEPEPAGVVTGGGEGRNEGVAEPSVSPHHSPRQILGNKIGSAPRLDVVSPRGTEETLPLREGTSVMSKKRLEKHSVVKPNVEKSSALDKIKVLASPNIGSFNRIQGFWSQHTQRVPSKSIAKPGAVLGTTTSNYNTLSPSSKDLQSRQNADVMPYTNSDRRLRGRSKSLDSFDMPEVGVSAGAGTVMRNQPPRRNAPPSKRLI